MPVARSSFSILGFLVPVSCEVFQNSTTIRDSHLRLNLSSGSTRSRHRYQTHRVSDNMSVLSVLCDEPLIQRHLVGHCRGIKLFLPSTISAETLIPTKMMAVYLQVPQDFLGPPRKMLSTGLQLRQLPSQPLLVGCNTRRIPSNLCGNRPDTSRVKHAFWCAVNSI